MRYYCALRRCTTETKMRLSFCTKDGTNCKYFSENYYNVICTICTAEYSILHLAVWRAHVSVCVCVCVCFTETERDADRRHIVHLNLSNVKVITAALILVCVTSEKEKEY